MGISTTSSGSSVVLNNTVLFGAGQKLFGSGQVAFYGNPGTSSFVVPVGVTSIRVRCVGAGGSGARHTAGNSYASAGGGGGGGYTEKVIATSPGTSYSFTVGAAAARGVSNANYNGTAGGNTTFDSILTATGGAGGTQADPTVSAIAAAAGGTGSGGDINYSGGAGGSIGLITGSTGSLSFATGGGAAGWWTGTGGRGGNIAGWNATATATNRVATGGGGVLGRGGDITLFSGVSNIATGGGGALFNATNQSTPAGVDGSGGFVSNNANGGTGTTLVSRFPGDVLFGGGSNGIVQGNTAITAGTGGPGAGGGSIYTDASTSNLLMIAGNGGFLGGGGALGGTIQSSSASGTRGGDGGIGGGGGAMASSQNVSGQTNGVGGNGFIVIEW